MKTEDELKPIRFLLLEAHYVPHDQHRIYLLGRTEPTQMTPTELQMANKMSSTTTPQKNKTMGVCAVTTFQKYFYIAKKTPFENETEAKDFIRKIQNHIDTLQEVHISNPYGVHSGKEDGFPSKLGWDQKYSGFGSEYNLQNHKDSWKTYGEKQASQTTTVGQRSGGANQKRTPAPKVCDNLRAFCVKFELIDNTHKTFAHYTPEGTYEQLLKIYVRLPYMANSLHLYFESWEFFRMIDLKKDLIKSFLATEDVALSFLLDNNLARGRWCTLQNYSHLYGENRVVYRSINVKFDLGMSSPQQQQQQKNIVCDHETVEAGQLRVLCLDCEMPAGVDPETGMTRFCRPVVMNSNGTLNTKNTDTDVCAVIVAMIFTVGVDSGFDFTEARAFTFKHPNQKSALPSNIDWAKKLQTGYKNAIKEENRRRKENPNNKLTLLDDLEELGYKKAVELENERRLKNPQLSLPLLVKSEQGGWKATFDEENSRRRKISDGGGGGGDENELLIEDDTAFTSPWNYDKLQIQEYSTEMDAIYAFEDFIHESDIDILANWNGEGFDFPFLYWRYIFHTHVLGGEYKNLRIPNFGALIGGFSSLKKEDGLFKKGDSYVVSTDMYTKNDGLIIWRKNAEEKPHSLNMVSSRELVYPLHVVQRGFILQRSNYSRMFSEIPKTLFNPPSDAHGKEDENEKKKKYVSKMSEWEIEYETFLALDNLEPKLVSGKDKFPMKKMEFDHSIGKLSWEEGGYLWLKYILYCMLDTLLAYMNLRVKGKILNQQSLCLVAGVNISDVIGRGEQMRVVNNIYINCRKRYDGRFVIPDKGYNHLHWHGVFHHPLGPRAAVLAQWDRLKPFEGVHPHLTDDGGDSIITTVLKPGQRGKKQQQQQQTTTNSGSVSKKKKKDGEPGNEGGFCQPLESGGIQEGYVTTLDFRSMYPYILFILNLCFSSALNSHTIAQYSVKKHEYFTKTIGAANRNMCGERIVDKESSAIAAIYTPDVKKTSFHQGCPTVLPPLVLDLAQERTNGKDAKALWGILNEVVKDINVFLHKKENAKSLLHKYPLLVVRYSSNEAKVFSVDWVKLRENEQNVQHFVYSCASWYWVQKGTNVDISDYITHIGLLSGFKARLFKDLCKAIMESTDPYTFVNLSKSNNINFEAYQLQVKVFMNSLYGVLMMCFGSLSYPELSATITSFGRYLLNLIRNIAECLTSEKAKMHKLCFGWSKKSFTKDVMEILVELYKRKIEEDPNYFSDKEYLEVDKENDGVELKEAKEMVTIRNLMDFIKSKEIMGLGFLRNIDNEMMSTLIGNNVLKSFQALYSIYGDSVTGDTALIVRINGEIIQTKRIDELITTWLDEKGNLLSGWTSHRGGEKEQCLTSNIEVWQNGGFTSVKRVIRHKCKKRIIRVLTRTGVVDCTEDHSLVTIEGKEISPNDVTIGDVLLHDLDDNLLLDLLSSPSKSDSNNTTPITVEEAYVMGVHAAAAAADDNEGYSSEPHGLEAGKFNDTIHKYRTLFYNKHGEKKIPHTILAAPLDVVQSFWHGFHATTEEKLQARGQHENQTFSRWEQQGKEMCTGMWILSRRLGWGISLDDILGKPHTFILTCNKSQQPQRKVGNTIKKKYTLLENSDDDDDDDDMYVYDLETESHHFHVGPGRLVVHNTDSIMVKLAAHSVVNRHQAFIVMNHLTEMINDKLIKEMLLQPEKITEVMNLHKQKNYDMKAMLKPDDNAKLDWLFKGSDKSDTLPFVNKILNMARAYLLLRIGEGHAKNLVFRSLCLIIKRELLKFVMGEISPAQLSITKKLSKFDPEGTATHNRVAIQMKNRGEPVNSGDLITYTHVLLPDGTAQILDVKTIGKLDSKGKKKKPVYRQAVESLDHVIKNDITLDLEYIWSNCIKNKLTTFLRNVVAPIFDHVCLTSVFPNTLRNQQTKKAIQQENQDKLVCAVMYEGVGDIEWRFIRRKKAAGSNKMVDFTCKTTTTSTSNSGGNNDNNTMKKPTKEYECTICYKFFNEAVSQTSTIPTTTTTTTTCLKQHPESNFDSKKKTKICPDCSGGKKHERIVKLQKKYEKTKHTYFSCRAICTVCVTLPESPCGREKEGKQSIASPTEEVQDIEDLMSPTVKGRTKPEDCTFIYCSTHVARTEARAALANYEYLIEKLSQHTI